uniref:Right handed beta helix domain-containing protein n=1 Tax=Plectus sambesii TaxID=2011161 RepID=A0A914XMU5_9BILA
ITNSNFTRNRGRLVYFDNVAGGSNLLLDQNLFSLNQLTNHSARQAIVSVHVGRDDPGITVKLSNNLFHKNTMERTITVEDNRDAPAYQLRLNIERNEFRDNLSPDVLLVDVPSANVTLNRFEDPQAKCELRTGPYRDGTRIDATSNYWGTVESAQVAKRVCDFKQQSTLLPAHYIPFMTDLPSGLPGGQLNHLANLEQPPTFGSAIQPIIASDDRIALGGALRENDVRIPATGDPYRVAQSVMIEQGQTLTIEPGARLEFEGGRGLRVRGKLIIRGTPDNPVILTGSSQNAWSGIIFDNQNSDQASSVEGCMIENALTGMVINSKQIHLASCRIVNSILSSIEIGPQSDTNIDFGDSLLEKSLDKGIRVATRALGITLQNVRITDSAGVGVDFDAPSEDITISNVKIANSGLFAVRIDQVPRFPIRSITIDGLTVSEQQRGQVGLFLNVLDYASVTVKNSLFTRNTVPSIQMELKCNYAANSDPSAPTVVPVPTFLFEENRIIDNSNLVATFSLAYCADATFRKNNFELNNRDHRFGTFELIAEPAPDQQKNFKLQISENVFLKNEGEYTVYLLPIIQYPFQGSFDQNKLTSNSNLRSALIVGSPLVKVNLNDFINPQSTYDLEVTE